MQNENTILSELKEISPLLASLNRQSELFRVPAGYFENFPGSLMDQIEVLHSTSSKKELEELSPLLSGMQKPGRPAIPANYFESFPDVFMKTLRAQETRDVGEELTELSPLLSQLDKRGPFKAPAGYFDELPENLTGGLKALDFVHDELDNRSSLIREWKDFNPFEVPENYFNSLPENILARVRAQHQEARVIPFYNRKSWFKYAAAAALTGILIGIGFFTFRPHKDNSLDPLSGLAKISDQEIVNFLQTEDIPLAGSANGNLASVEWTDNDARDLFNDIPDADLIQYMNERNLAKDTITN